MLKFIRTLSQYCGPPPRVWRPPHQARCVHGPAAAFNIYKSRAFPAARPFFSSILSQHLSLGRLTSLCAANPYLRRPTLDDPSAALTAAENDGISRFEARIPDLPLWIRCSR